MNSWNNADHKKKENQFESLIPKAPLLEGQLSVLVRVKCPANDAATFFIEVNPLWVPCGSLHFCVTFVKPEYCFDIVIQIGILKDVAAQLLLQMVKLEQRRFKLNPQQIGGYFCPPKRYASYCATFHLVELWELLEVEQFVFCSVLVVKFCLYFNWLILLIRPDVSILSLYDLFYKHLHIFNTVLLVLRPFFFNQLLHLRGSL